MPLSTLRLILNLPYLCIVGLITIAYLPSAAAVAKPSALDDKSSTGKTSSSSGKIGSSSSEEYVIATQQPQARGRSHETTSTAASIVGGITHLLSNTIGSIGSRSESKRDTALQNNCDLWGNDVKNTNLPSNILIQPSFLFLSFTILSFLLVVSPFLPSRPPYFLFLFFTS